MIHVIGDSHVVVFSGFEVPPQGIDNTGFLPFFRAYRLGPYTAYNAEKRREVIESVLERKVAPGDSVMLCFGEIDCRVHLIEQSESQHRPLEDVVTECVTRYAHLFDIKEKYGIRLLVWNAIPSSTENIDSGEYSTHGTCRERNEVTRIFNGKLKEECEKRGITFVSVFDRLIDDDGLTKAEYYSDAVHLSQKAMPVILEEFRRLNILVAPVLAGKHDQPQSPQEASHSIHKLEPVGQNKSVLICCGIHNFAELIATRPRYDLCYIIEAEKALVAYAEALYSSDRLVSILHMPSVNLLQFCREYGIERIDKLKVDTRADDIALVRSIDRFIKKKKVREVECWVPQDRVSDLARLFGESYRVGVVSQPGGKNRLVQVRCELQRHEKTDRREASADHPVFNAVYGGLLPEHEHSVHRGSVSVVWSRLPLVGCDLYLYLNAYSFTGRQEGLNVLYLCEPVVVLPLQYDEAIWRNFDHVVTHYDPLVAQRANFSKVLIPESGIHAFPIVFDITERMDERERKYPLEGRNPGICMINGNKTSGVKGELYSKRVEAALWFHENSAITFDVFGNPPFSLPNYKGILPQDQKLATLSHYKYSLCFENIYHQAFSAGYVDKILNCLETRTIPIYLGAGNIDAYVPGECFIDFRSFRDYGELDRFLATMSEKQYRDYIDAIDDFVSNGGLQPHTWNALYDHLVQMYAVSKDKSVASLSTHDSKWEWGLSEATASRDFRMRQGEAMWSFGQLANYSGEVTITGGGEVSRSGDKRQVMDRSVDGIAGTAGQGSQSDLQNEMDRVGRIVESGSCDVNDIYRYAQLFIVAGRFDESVPVLERVISLFPGHTYALNDMAVIRCRKNDFDAAIGFWRKALEADPANQDALRNTIQIMKALNKEGEIVALAEETLGRPFGSEEAYERTLGILRESGVPKEILDRPARALHGGPTADRQSQTQDRAWLSSEERDSYDKRPAGTKGDVCYVHKTAQLERQGLITIGRNAEIKDYVIIRTYDNPVTIGEYTQLNPFTVIYGGSGVKIGNNVMIAPHCMIASGNHDYIQTDVPMRFAGNLTKGPIVIEDNVWIGANSTIADGVKVGRESVVAANSLVNKDVEPYSIVGGVPAKPIGHRLKGKTTKNSARPDKPKGVMPTGNGRDEQGAIVFSKDRAMQLDCTLRSLYLHCKDIDRLSIKVIYTTSSQDHERAYQRLKEEFSSVDFVKERVFRDDLLSSISLHEYVLFLVDDNIFVRDFRMEDVIGGLKQSPAAIGVSLRLGRNTTYCYMLNSAQRLPVFEEVAGDLLSFDWTISEYDFGYPLEVSSSIYRVSDILPVLKSLNFTNPNTLEALLDANKGAFGQNRPRLLCYGTSVTFCSPVNKVQNVYANNRAGRDDRHGAGNLAVSFLEGQRIDIERYSGFTPNSCHQEVDLCLVGRVAHGEAGLAAPLVSIVILNTNGRKEIEACLDSIERNTPESHEVIVLDNGSSDGSPDYLRARTDVVLIESPVNIGVAPARAKAMGYARGTHLVLLDNDTVVTAGWIAKFLAHIDSDKRIGILGPRSNYVSGMQVVPGAKYGTIEELEEFARRWSGQQRDRLTASLRLVGFCMFIRREVVDKVGSIDASFGKFGFEDDDYTIRANIAGFKTAIANDVFIHHTGGPQGQGNSEYNGLLMKAWERFKEKWGIPMETPYGATLADRIVTRPFDASKHFIPLMPPDHAGECASSHRSAKGQQEMEAVASDGESAEEHFKKALAHEEAGKTDSAIEELERVVAIDDRHPGAHNDLGVLYYQKGNRQGALQMLSKAVMLQPDDVGCLKNLAAVALELGETEDAIGLYTKILALVPEDIETLLVVGHLCEQGGQTESALHFLQTVIEKEPGHAQAVEAVERIRKSGAGGKRSDASGQRDDLEPAAVG
jgi:acetyltransferase-like isoleucine patch superfamily enzyme/GT2 family glycosyltransferase/Tfp pilus assembly protein PilF